VQVTDPNYLLATAASTNFGQRAAGTYCYSMKPAARCRQKGKILGKGGDGV
jgi:hypothetical protein